MVRLRHEGASHMSKVETTVIATRKEKEKNNEEDF